MVWHVNEIFELKLTYFDKYLSMERMNKAKYIMQMFRTFDEFCFRGLAFK